MLRIVLPTAVAGVYVVAVATLYIRVLHVVVVVVDGDVVIAAATPTSVAAVVIPPRSAHCHANAE